MGTQKIYSSSMNKTRIKFNWKDILSINKITIEIGVVIFRKNLKDTLHVNSVRNESHT